MSAIDPRPGARRSGRTGRVFDRALDALSEIDAHKPADLALRHVESRARDLGAHERKELRALVFGLLRRRRRVRDLLARATSAERKRLDDLEPPIRRRLEILADRADRDRSVEELDGLDARVHRRFARVLGRIAAGRLPAKRTGNPEAIEHNLPDWLWARFREGLGDDRAAVVASALAGRAPVTARVRGGDVEPVLRALERDEIRARPTVISRVGLVLPFGTDLRATTAYRDGQIELQDEGSQLVGLSAASPGRRVLDACAGAGGKTLQLVEAAASVVALEPDEAKRRELRRRLERAGAQAEIVPQTLEAYAERPESFDVVLVDAPCTGTGTLRRHPDLALQLTPEGLARDVARQKRLIAAARRCLRPGGRLVYATCSVLTDENEDIVDYARVEAPDLRPVPVFAGAPAERTGKSSRLRIGPGWGPTGQPAAIQAAKGSAAPDSGDDGGPDGFFIAAFERATS